MEVIKLNKSQFEWFNDCDCNKLYSDQIDQKYNNLPEEEKHFFNYEHFITELNNELFDKYDFIIVTESNEIYGIAGNDKTFLKKSLCAFDCATKIVK
jgi:hypothetical protein